jgi:hypothetical protein
MSSERASATYRRVRLGVGYAGDRLAEPRRAADARCHGPTRRRSVCPTRRPSIRAASYFGTRPMAASTPAGVGPAPAPESSDSRSCEPVPDRNQASDPIVMGELRPVTHGYARLAFGTVPDVTSVRITEPSSHYVGVAGERNRRLGDRALPSARFCIRVTHWGEARQPRLFLRRSRGKRLLVSGGYRLEVDRDRLNEALAARRPDQSGTPRGSWPPSAT